jgi:UDP-N-acetylglucosamine diphosphorylase/glucosamine-1-phosphate N-acetyltransferase
LKAVILAAGEGKRLRPLTTFKPKLLLPVGGRPLLDIILSSMEQTEIKNVLIVVKHLKEKIIEKYRASNSSLKLSFLEQKDLLGTANAIQITQDFIGNEEFLVINGDILTKPIEVKNLIDFYKRKKPFCALAVKKVENPCSYGIVDLRNGKVSRIIEKPDQNATKNNLVSVGIMCFNPKIFDIIKQTPISSRGEYEITKSLEIAINKGEIVLPYQIESWWVDIGTPWDYLKANQILLSEMEDRREGIIEKGAILKGTIIALKDSIIRSGAYLEGPILVDEGSDIGPNCYIRSSTYIGKNCRIGNACEIKNSIILDNTHIGHLSYVGDSIIGSEVNFGAGTIIANLRFDDKTVKMNIKGKKTDSGRRKLGVVIGDGVKTGIGVNILTGVKIGAKSVICPNVTVWEDIPEGKILNVKKIEYELKEWKPT